MFLLVLQLIKTRYSSPWMPGCNLHDGSLETVVNMRYGLSYDHGEGVNFVHGPLPFLHYMVPYVESLLRIGPLLAS